MDRSTPAPPHRRLWLCDCERRGAAQVLPASRVEQCLAYFDHSPPWHGPGNRLVLLPLFQMFHVYLDALYEKW